MTAIQLLKSCLGPGAMLALAVSAPAVAVQELAAPTTITLSLESPIAAPMTDRRPGPGVGLPRESQVLGETSAPAGRLPVATPVPEALVPPPESQPAMPSRVDRRSTESLFLQVQRFEDNNMIGEASLLALQLVTLDPLFEPGWLAAVRTALVQDRLVAAAEICSQAIRAGHNGLLFGMLQVHILRRANDRNALRRATEERIKELGQDFEGRLAAIRLHMAAGDDQAARTAWEALPAAERGRSYAAAMIAARLARTAPSTSPFIPRARAAMDQALSSDLPTEDLAALLLESLESEPLSPPDLLRRLSRTLSVEPSHAVASSLADHVASRLRDQRKLQPMLREAEKRANAGDDVAAFVAARTRRMGHDTTGALHIMEQASTSPLPFIRREWAELLLENGRPVDAQEPLRRLLDETPADVPLRLDLAEALLADGRVRDALDNLDGLNRGVLNLAQQRRAARLAVAAAARIDIAPLVNTWLELARVAGPDDWIAAADEMVARLEPSRRRQTIDALTAAAIAAQNDSSAEAFEVATAALLDAEGQQRDALRALIRALAAHPAHVGLTMRLAQTAQRAAETPLLLSSDNGNGDKDDAQSTATTAVTKSVALRDIQSSDIAIAALRRLIVLQPHEDGHVLALMQAYQARGEVERAKGAVVEVLGATGDDVPPVVAARVARILDDGGFPVDALVFYRKAVLDPDDLDSWLRYAGALRETGDLEKAVIVCQTIIDKGFHGRPYAQSAVLLALHRMAQARGRTSEFIDFLKERRTRDIPGRERFLLEGARLLAAEGARADALLMVREGLAVADPEGPVAAELLFLQARLRFEAREYEAAAKAFSALADKFPRSPLAVPALFNAGDVWRRAGSPRLAVERWTALATRHSDNDQALAALFEAGLVAYSEIKEPLLARSLFRQLVESGCQDLALLAAARRNVERLDQGLDPLPAPPGTSFPAQIVVAP